MDIIDVAEVVELQPVSKRLLEGVHRFYGQMGRMPRQIDVAPDVSQSLADEVVMPNRRKRFLNKMDRGEVQVIGVPVRNVAVLKNRVFEIR